MTDERALSIVVKPQDMTLLTEGGLITAEAAKKLEIAAASIPAMRDASTPVGQRHFGRADTLLTVRNPSPVNQARDVLESLHRVWTGAGQEFHRLRAMAFGINLRQKKLALQRKKLDAIENADEREIAEAECMVAQAEIDGLQAQFAEGQTAIKDVIAKATHQSEQYALLCQKAGVEAFTSEDFLREEVEYLIKTAFFHAGQTFKLVDIRDQWARKEEEPEPPKGRAEANKRLMKARRETMQIKTPLDVVAYFEALGITKAELRKELEDLEKDKFAFDQCNSGPAASGHYAPQSYFECFERWLKDRATKYRDRVLAHVREQGPDRLRRIQQIITPTTEDKGKTGGQEMDRGSLFE